MVSDGGRVASLIYRRTPYGQVRMYEFAGHVDPVFFQKFVYRAHVTQVRVNGRKGLWIKGPHELLYITRLATIIESYESEPLAIASFSKPAN